MHKLFTDKKMRISLVTMQILTQIIPIQSQQNSIFAKYYFSHLVSVFTIWDEA